MYKTNNQALVAFMVTVNEIRDHLVALSAHVDNHLEIPPDDVTWDHQVDARRALELLIEVGRWLSLQ